MKVALYTCIVNNRDTVKSIEFKDSIDYVLFTDSNIKSDDWDVRSIIKEYEDPVRTARYHKHHPFELFPDYDYVIWLDATHWPYNSVFSLISNFEISTMIHPLRKTVEAEAEACLGLDDPQIIKNQIARYKADGFLDDIGLFSTACVIYKNTEQTKKFNYFWWEEIQKGSRRDQLSYPYCLWKSKINYGILPGVCRLGFNPVFKMKSHYTNKMFL